MTDGQKSLVLRLLRECLEYFDARAKIEEKDDQPWQNVEQFLSDEVLSVIELLEGKAMSNIKPIIKRMRRKLEVMYLDRKAAGDIVSHDIQELLSLIDMLERELAIEGPFTAEDIEDMFTGKDVGI